jgi:hypothetical protein
MMFLLGLILSVVFVMGIVALDHLTSEWGSGG